LLAHEADEAAVVRLAIACRELFALAENAGGFAVIEFCPMELKRQVNVWGPPRDDGELMRRLKHAFDPGGVLSPGRSIGGL